MVMEITSLILENHGIVFLNFCGNNKDWLGFVTNHVLKKACMSQSFKLKKVIQEQSI